MKASVLGVVEDGTPCSICVHPISSAKLSRLFYPYVLTWVTISSSRYSRSIAASVAQRTERHPLQANLDCLASQCIVTKPSQKVSRLLLEPCQFDQWTQYPSYGVQPISKPHLPTVCASPLCVDFHSALSTSNRLSQASPLATASVSIPFKMRLPPSGNKKTPRASGSNCFFRRN